MHMCVLSILACPVCMRAQQYFPPCIHAALEHLLYEQLCCTCNLAVSAHWYSIPLCTGCRYRGTSQHLRAAGERGTAYGRAIVLLHARSVNHGSTAPHSRTCPLTPVSAPLYGWGVSSGSHSADLSELQPCHSQLEPFHLTVSSVRANLRDAKKLQMCSH